MRPQMKTEEVKKIYETTEKVWAVPSLYTVCSAVHILNFNQKRMEILNILRNWKHIQNCYGKLQNLISKFFIAHVKILH